jgi:hypothetical protein
MSKKDSDSEEGAPPPGDLNDAALVREFFEHRERVANVLAEHTERFFNLRDEVNQRLTAHEAAVGEKIASRLRVYGWGGALAVAGGILAILLGYWRAEREFHDAFRARLDDEFAAPKVQAAIQDAARLK